MTCPWVSNWPFISKSGGSMVFYLAYSLFQRGDTFKYMGHVPYVHKQNG